MTTCSYCDCDSTFDSPWGFAFPGVGDCCISERIRDELKRGVPEGFTQQLQAANQKAGYRDMGAFRCYSVVLLNEGPDSELGRRFLEIYGKSEPKVHQNSTGSPVLQGGEECGFRH